MDQPIRNKLRSAVTQCRKLLENSTAQALESRFGIYMARKKGEIEIEDESFLTHLAEEDRDYRRDLLVYLDHIQAIGYKSGEALEQLVREIAFTHLNRMCAYKMMEARGLIREAVSRGLKSQGFFFFLSDHPEDEKLHNGGGQETAYRHFLDWLGGTLSQEIGVLFNPNDPANRIYPPQRILDEVMALVNDVELKDIWAQDETIGWIYQYFTPKELRDKARKESQAPRNSYELAFRNQFFTPRYVVEFLSDNTLGRIWYEMRKGETVLRDRCQYLIRRPTEIFLKEGEEPPKSKDAHEYLSQEEQLRQPVYISHRPKKDPREIKVLDPSCGSGHFLLYCFDLLQVIYEEAYDDPDLSAAFRKDYPAIEDLRRAVPGMILKHNLHGIDIDLRATQIAALALWLRCQRAYQVMGLKDENRRKMITRSNIVCAEPMPGETDLLKEFTSTLQPKVLGQLVEVIFEKMKLAGEAGSLLKIEEEIREVAATAKKEFQEELLRQEKQTGYLPGFAPQRELSRFDFSDMTDSEFLDRVEEEIVLALRQYAEKSSNGKAYRKRLFSEDAERGFALIDVCRKLFDVVLMNPPFGEFSKPYKMYSRITYPNSYNDILGAFVERWIHSLSQFGRLGAITSRTCFFLNSFTDWREKVILTEAALTVVADLGQGIMDNAMVEAAAYILERSHQKSMIPFIRAITEVDREKIILDGIGAIKSGSSERHLFFTRQNTFRKLANAPFVYWADSEDLDCFTALPTFEPEVAEVRQGLATGDDARFVRSVWEVSPKDTQFVYYPTNGETFCRFDAPIILAYFQRRHAGTPRWAFHVKSGASQPWYSPITLKINWHRDGFELRNFRGEGGKLRSRPQNTDYFYRPGLSWTRRAARFYPYMVPGNCIPSVSRYMAFPEQGSEYAALGVSASLIASAFMRFYGEMFERPNFLVETLKNLPWPNLSEDAHRFFQELIQREIQQRRWAYMNHEPFHEFLLPIKIRDFSSGGQSLSFDPKTLLGKEGEHLVADAYGLDQKAVARIERDVIEALKFQSGIVGSGENLEVENNEEESCEETDFMLDNSNRAQIDALISYCIGCLFGRWDIRIALDPSLAPNLPGPFEPLPVCSFGTLVGPDGLPADPGCIVSEDWLRVRPDLNTLPVEGALKNTTITDDDYPLRISWDGILVDDSGHEADIVCRVRDVLESIWKDRAEAIEREVCAILGVRELRDYFRKPGNGGFWMDHVKRYSKSRRKAPIYWYLRSAKGNYGLWLYYHRLDKDILFKVLINYVEPKIRLEEGSLKSLRGRKESAGSSGPEAKQIEKDIDRQEQFVSEMRDFADKLRRAADLHIEPDLNDGVILNIALLWELVPWKEAKEYWEDLVDGKFEWSSIGKQLVKKGLGKK